MNDAVHSAMHSMGMDRRGLGRGMRWRDLPRGAQRGIRMAAVVQVALLLSAAIDLARRPAAQIRSGHKWRWLPLLFVNILGPIAYFVFGRVAPAAGAEGAASGTEGAR